MDDDATALAYARRNAADTEVEVVAGDVTDPALLAELDGAVHLLVANPPYIPDGAVLEPEVAQHDPAHALYGGVDGMSVIVPIVSRAARLLAPGGLLAIEHDDSTAAATVAEIAAVPVPGSLRCAFTDVTAHRDLTGRPRFVTARRSGGQERSEKGIEAGGQERSEKGIEAGGQERSETGIEAGGQERSDPGNEPAAGDAQ